MEELVSIGLELLEPVFGLRSGGAQEDRVQSRDLAQQISAPDFFGQELQFSEGTVPGLVQSQTAGDGNPDDPAPELDRVRSSAVVSARSSVFPCTWLMRRLCRVQ